MLVGNLVYARLCHALSMLPSLIGQCWPAGARRIRRLGQGLTHLNASEIANRAVEQLKSFFGDDFVESVVKEDR